MGQELKILLLEDSDSDANLLMHFLKSEQIECCYTRVWDKEKFQEALRKEIPDLVIADHSMPQFNGMEAFRLMKAEGLNLPFIMVTGAISEGHLMQCLREGIDDYLLKSNLLRLPAAIENVLNKKKNEALNTQLLKTNQELQKTYSEIHGSITYAKLIQDAMLPDPRILQQSFPKSFVFFKPKHTLSGDFYWYEKKQDTFWIAAVDCTGHGIPGALLSMMGNNLLNEAVNVYKLGQPSHVLDFMNARVRKILKHDTSSLSDGMDMNLCAVNMQTMEMMYAGANRPLFLVRERALLEFKPDKISIGGIYDDQRKFTNHIIPIKENDMIFIFSDGFADQFNDTNKKRMSVKRLRELLTKCAVLPLAAQESIITAFFEEWKGDNEQLDDVLMIGLNIEKKNS